MIDLQRKQSTQSQAERAPLLEAQVRHTHTHTLEGNAAALTYRLDILERSNTRGDTCSFSLSTVCLAGTAGTGLRSSTSS